MDNTMIISVNNDMEFIFNSRSRATKHGFAHDCTLSIFDNNDQWNYEQRKATCYYLNRTWESYRFQSVHIAAINRFIEQRKDELLYNYKYKNNIKRMTKKRLIDFEQIAENDIELALYKTVRHAIQYGNGYNKEIAFAM